MKCITFDYRQKGHKIHHVYFLPTYHFKFYSFMRKDYQLLSFYGFPPCFAQSASCMWCGSEVFVSGEISKPNFLNNFVGMAKTIKSWISTLDLWQFQKELRVTPEILHIQVCLQVLGALLLTWKSLLWLQRKLHLIW